LVVDELLDGVDTVIVDWDGTVVDSQQANYTAINQALRPYGLTMDLAWYRQRTGLSIADLLTEITVVHGDLPTNEIITASRQQQLASLNQLRPIPATIALLDAAKARGLRCAVASGAANVLVLGAIDALHLRHLFAAIVTREDVDHGKPAPDLYLRAAEMLGTPPGRCLAVDDAAEGIAAAISAGMRALTLRDGRLAWAPPPLA
jgi:HAD superfamily hydrolase (TIGR01509 family)